MKIKQTKKNLVVINIDKYYQCICIYIIKKNLSPLYHPSDQLSLRIDLPKSGPTSGQQFLIYGTKCHKDNPSQNFISGKLSWKCHLHISSHFIEASIQLSAIIVQSNLSWYKIQHSNNSGRQWIRFYIHNKHPISRPHGRAMGCLLWGICEKMNHVIMAPHC